MKNYSSLLESDSALYYEIGPNPGEIMVVIRGEPSEGNGGIFKVKSKVCGEYLEWWNKEKVKKGKYYTKFWQPAYCYEVILSEDQGIIYIYWYYS